MSSEDEESLAGLTQNTFLRAPLVPSFNLLDGILDLGDGIFGQYATEYAADLEKDKDLDEVIVEEVKCGKPQDKRNISLVTDKQLENFKDTRIPENTKRNTTWAVRVWQDWAKERNARVKELGIDDKLVIPDISKMADDELGYWLAKFVVEIRKKGDKGEFYPATSLYQLCCGLLRFLRNNGRAALNIFEDPTFKHFQDSLDAEMKCLTRLGVGANVRQAEAFSAEQEERLWNSNLLGAHSPSTLLNTMVFLIGKNFSLRSGKEHRGLKFSQLRLEPPTADEPEKLIYTSFGEKNNLGGLKHRAFKRKRVEHYANEACSDRCMVSLYKKYVEKCPPEAMAKDVFYVAPRRKCSNSDKVWFTSNPVGHNTLGDTVKNLCRDAGIEGYYTNHSLRATTATRGLEKGIAEKFIMERTGHRDVRSLQRYQRPTVQKKVEISRAFDLTSCDKKANSYCGEVSGNKSVSNSKEQIDIVRTEDDPKNCGHKSSETNGAQFNNCTFYVGNDFTV